MNQYKIRWKIDREVFEVSDMIFRYHIKYHTLEYFLEIFWFFWYPLVCSYYSFVTSGLF